MSRGIAPRSLLEPRARAAGSGIATGFERKLVTSA